MEQAAYLYSFQRGNHFASIQIYPEKRENHVVCRI